MTVEQLMKELSKLPPKHLVVLSADGEGNSFDTLGRIGTNNRFNAKDREIRIDHLTPELEKEGYCEDDIGEGLPCVVLWP
jgi:hypothetical protein